MASLPDGDATNAPPAPQVPSQMVNLTSITPGRPQLGSTSAFVRKARVEPSQGVLKSLSDGAAGNNARTMAPSAVPSASFLPMESKHDTPGKLLTTSGPSAFRPNVSKNTLRRVPFSAVADRSGTVPAILSTSTCVGSLPQAKTEPVKQEWHDHTAPASPITPDVSPSSSSCSSLPQSAFPAVQTVQPVQTMYQGPNTPMVSSLYASQGPVTMTTTQPAFSSWGSSNHNAANKGSSPVQQLNGLPHPPRSLTDLTGNSVSPQVAMSMMQANLARAQMAAAMSAAVQQRMLYGLAGYGMTLNPAMSAAVGMGLSMGMMPGLSNPPASVLAARPVAYPHAALPAAVPSEVTTNTTHQYKPQPRVVAPRSATADDDFLGEDVDEDELVRMSMGTGRTRRRRRRSASSFAATGKHKCAECGIGFATRFSLKRHGKKHTGERPFQCPFQDCARRFAEKSTLTRHLRTHTGERPYVCTFPGCHKAFADRTNVRRHMMTHKTKKVFVCPSNGCKRTFIKKSSMLDHFQDVHHGRRNYPPHPKPPPLKSDIDLGAAASLLAQIGHMPTPKSAPSSPSVNTSSTTSGSAVTDSVSAVPHIST